MEKEYAYPALLAFGYDGGRLSAANFVGLSGCWVEGEDREDVIKRAPEVLKEYLKCCIEAEYRVEDPLIMEEFGLLFEMSFCICLKRYRQSGSQNMSQKEWTYNAAAESGAVCGYKK